MKSYKVKYVAPLAIAGAAALGFVVGNSTPAPAADMGVYGAKTYGAKKKAMYGKKSYGAKEKMGYGAKKKMGYGAKK